MFLALNNSSDPDPHLSIRLRVCRSVRPFFIADPERCIKTLKLKQKYTELLAKTSFQAPMIMAFFTFQVNIFCIPNTREYL